MKTISVIGSGKTGSKVIELLNHHSQFKLGAVYNSTNEPTKEKLLQSDAIIIFVTGEVLHQLMPMLSKLDKPIICGTTGFNYEPFKNELEKRTSPWIHGSNFSLGVHLMRKMIEEIKLGQELFDHPHISIHEIHHTKKLDSPSGTAKSMASWLGDKLSSQTQITAERTGDVVGTHILDFKTEFETITLKHVAHDRLLFASGALKTLELTYLHPQQNNFLSIENFLDLTLFNTKRSL
jgi:4-hydroxy-tetrahydrodipicolinate reductase